VSCASYAIEHPSPLYSSEIDANELLAAASVPLLIISISADVFLP
jgi:hypothetical protein